MLNKYKMAKAYHDTFDGKQGKMVLHDLIRTAGLFQTCASADPHIRSIKDGERNIVLRILAFLGYKETEALDLIEEARNYIIREDNDDR